MHLRPVAALLAALLLIPASGAAAHDLPGSVVRADLAAEASGLLGLDGRGVPLTPLEIAASLPSAISEEWGSESITASAEDDETVPSGSVAIGGNLGYDATGDGLEDVGGYQFDLETDTYSLFVWDGATGETVFTTDGSGENRIFSLTAFLAGDRSGDGVTDIIELGLVTDSVDSSCTEDDDSYDCTYDERFTWSVDLISGATGERLRERSQDGYFRGFDRGDADGYAYQIEARNLFPLPLPADDLDGDGIGELIVQDEDIFVSGSSEDERVVDVDVTATVLAADWTALGTFSANDRQALSELRAAGDMTGDGIGELLWSTPVDLGERTDETCPVGLPLGLERTLGLCSTHTYWATGLRLEIVDGRDLSTFRDLQLEDSDGQFFFARVFADDDIDGDGIVDPRLFTFDWENVELLRFDPTDGSTLWSFASEDFVGAGEPVDLDADGTAELVLRGTRTSSRMSATEETTTSSFTQVVLDQATGEVRTAQTVSETRDYFASCYVFVFGGPYAVDLSGDGIADPIYSDIFGSYDADTDTCQFESVLRVLDATDLEQQLLVRDSASVRFFATAASPSAGATPWLVEADYGPGFDSDSVMSLVDGADRTVRETLTDVAYVSSLPSADGSDDLLLSTIRETDDRFTSTIARRDLDTPELRWSRVLD